MFVQPVTGFHGNYIHALSLDVVSLFSLHPCGSMVLRVPKRKKRSSPDDQPENKLAKRFRDSAGKQTGEASSSSQSNTPHPAAQTPRQQKLVVGVGCGLAARNCYLATSAVASLCGRDGATSPVGCREPMQTRRV